MSELTRGHSGRWLILATIFATMVALAIFTTARDASGFDVDADVGVILVSTGPAGGDVWIRYYADPIGPLDVTTAIPDASQSINVSGRCKVTSGDNLLKITSDGGTKGLGLVSNGFGVRTKNNCSTAQGRIASGQKLTFELGSKFDSTIAIDSVEVDVEGKHGADLGYDVYDGEGEQLAPLSNSSDNGPDSGTNDNEIKTLTGVDGANFTKITFTAIGPGAQLSIEGGGDGTIAGGDERTELGVNQTLFKLVTSKTYDAGDLSCGDEKGPTMEVEEGPHATDILLSRGQNLIYEGKGNPPCVDVPYSLHIDGDSVFFDADLTGQENANFLIRIDWDPASPTINPLNTPVREINFLPDDPGSIYEPIVACLSLIDEGTISDPEPDIDDEYEHPTDGEDIVPWCLAGETLTLLDTGKWQQIQWYDGAGDPKWR